MDIIKSKHYVENNCSSIIYSYLPGKIVGVLDIETLGLNGEYSPMVLAGLMTIDNSGNATITQFFAEEPDDEAELINSLLDSLKSCDYIFTYNGKHFDIPFIVKRSEIHGINFPMFPYNLDLYLFLRGHSQLRYVLPNLKQKTVERYMGISTSRDDEISGAESVELYYKFLNATSRNEKNKIKEKILLHNHDDILQLYKLMPILQKIDIHKAFFFNGFVVKGCNSWPSLEVKKITVGAKSLSFSGTSLGKDTFQYANYYDPKHPYECFFNNNLTFSFKVPTKRLNNSVYVDLKEFFNGKTISSSFAFLPECVNSFLILKDQGSVNYGATNKLVMNLITTLMNETPFPL